MPDATAKKAGTSSVNAIQNLPLTSGGTMDVQGTLILKKNLVNQNASVSSLGSGTIILSGTVSQSISGQNTIQSLNLNNPAGVTVDGTTRVNGVLTLTNGLVSLGSYNLLLGPAASVSGSPSSASMVVATGTGELRKEFVSASGFTFPVGDATVTAEYSPVTLTFSSGTFGTDNYAGVRLTNNQFPGTAVSYLTRYWYVTESAITGFSCNASFKYVDADVSGTEGDIFCFKVDPVPFTTYNAANAGSNVVDAHGLSSFGTFTGNLGNATVPPEVRSLQDKTISTSPECADATQTLLIAGNGTTYLVTSTGNVKHIAGTNIFYYPGTIVSQGGYMNGYISAVFCNPYIHPSVSTPVIAGVENPGLGNPGNTFFRIFPNPTPGKFTLELNGKVTTAKVRVEILGVLGERILSKEMQDRIQDFSLMDKPSGVYLVHVISGTGSETIKIIKK
jgi:hypothetical protein